MTENLAIQNLQQLLNLEPERNMREEEALKILRDTINHWLLHNFQALISLLYRVDISEEKLKYQLKLRAGEDAAKIIAELILLRLQEKAVTRNQFKSDTSIPEEDKW